MARRGPGNRRGQHVAGRFVSLPRARPAAPILRLLIWIVSEYVQWEEWWVGKAARNRRRGTARQGATAPRNRSAGGGGQGDDPRARAQAAVTRLVRGNPPGKVSLAGAYALGFGALGMA